MFCISRQGKFNPVQLSSKYGLNAFAAKKRFENSSKFSRFCNLHGELTRRRLILSGLYAGRGDSQRLGGSARSTCYAGKVDTWGLDDTVRLLPTFPSALLVVWILGLGQCSSRTTSEPWKRGQILSPSPPSSVKVACDILCPLNICFHCCFIAYWNMYRGLAYIFMANIWSTSSL